MLRLHRLVGPPRRTEQRLELAGKDRAKCRLAVLPGHLHAVVPMTEVRKIELEPAVALQVHQRLDVANKARLAVRREAHDLELVAVLGEPEVLRDREIKQSKRVREKHAAIHLEPRAGKPPP